MNSGRVKQSKAMSAVGFLGGLVFVGIGVAGAIPHLGIFGIAWTVIACLITAYHGFALFSNRGGSVYEIEIEEGPNGFRSVEDRLRELENAKRKGLVTESEYQSQRAKIISGI